MTKVVLVKDTNQKDVDKAESGCFWIRFN